MSDLPYEENPGQTHYEGCWRAKHHHNCAVAEVERRQAALDAKTRGLTLEEQATNAETWAHIHQVQKFLLDMAEELHRRILEHDQSKLGPPEVDTFTKFTPKLADSTYGSEEYKGFLREMKPALDHHYGNNRHHPEHFENGIEDMNLIDLLEMMVDWKAATMRHGDGDIQRSLDINRERFGISPQLQCILRNTVADLMGSYCKHRGEVETTTHLGLPFCNLCGKEALFAALTVRAQRAHKD